MSLALACRIAALLLFVVAFFAGQTVIAGYAFDELDWVALGLAAWVASTLIPAKP